MLRKRFSLLVAASPLVVSVGASAAEKEKQKITISHGGDALHYFPMYVARGAGFFADEGLDVDWINVSSGTKQAASVMGGSADMSPMALIHVIKSVSEGGNLVAIGAVYNINAQQVVISKEMMTKIGITPGMTIDEKVKRMRGLKMGVSSPGSATDAFMRSLFHARGLDPDAVIKIQPLGTGTAILAAFESKLIDGFVYPAPIPQMAVTKGIGEVIIDPFTGEVPEMKGTSYVALTTSRDELTAKPAIIAGTLRALTKAMRYARDKKDQTHKLMRQYFPDLTQPVFDLAVETYRKATPTTPMLTREEVDKTVAWMNLGSSKAVKARYEEVFAAGPASKASLQ